MANSNDSLVLIAAFGNPNVDITVKVDDTYLFEKYSLPIDGHVPATTELLDNIKEDITKRNYEVLYTPGGCAQNTLRVFQWLYKKPFNSVIIGSIGVDNEGAYLEKELENSGVRTLYKKLEDFRTASVVLLAYKGDRTAVYGFKLGAASMYSVSHLFENNETFLIMKNCKIVHLEAFFTVHSVEVGLEVLKFCEEHDILTSFNLCGTYVLTRDENAVIPFAQRCDIVIGNSIEFIALCKVLGINYDNIKKALQTFYDMSASYMKKKKNYSINNMKEYGKVLIITNGSRPIYCVTKKYGIIEYNVPDIEKNKIKDTTGAGDAFLAGFFYGIFHELSITKCLEMGCKISREIIQTHGCTLPGKDSSHITS